MSPQKSLSVDCWVSSADPADQVMPICEPSFEYNVAHDGDYVLLAVQRGGQRRIGVDVMAIATDQVELLFEALEDQVSQQF